MSLKIDTTTRTGNDKKYKTGKPDIPKMIAKHDFMPCKCMKKAGFIPFKKGIHFFVFDHAFCDDSKVEFYFVSTSPTNPFGRNHVSGYVPANDFYCETCTEYSDYFGIKDLF